MIRVRHETVADAHLQQHAVRALRAQLRADLTGRVFGLTGAVVVVDVVIRVVVVLEEVPPRDVVDVAVVVVVDAVGEGANDVARVDQRVLVLGVLLDTRVVGVVGHVEHAVTVGVVVLHAAAASAAVRLRKFPTVQYELLHQLRPLFIPADAAVHHRDDRVGPARGGLPRDVGARAPHAEEFLRVQVHRRVVVSLTEMRRVVRQLPFAAAVEVRGQVAARGTGLAVGHAVARAVLDVQPRVVIDAAGLHSVREHRGRRAGQRE